MINKKRLAVMLLVILCVGLAAGLTLGRYAGEWKHLFGLLISPNADTQRRYFRSNELRPVSEGAAYTVHGTSALFTVANALDSATVSEGEVSYTLTWYASSDGAVWTEYKTETASFEGGAYAKNAYTVEPVTVDGTVCNHVKVRGATSSLAQEDIEAVYTFSYQAFETVFSYADGVIAVYLNTHDEAGDYIFRWEEGVAPDNSDPTGLFSAAVAGPSSATLTAGKHSGYTYLFFVTDSDLYEQLEADSTAIGTAVTVEKQ